MTKEKNSPFRHFENEILLQQAIASLLTHISGVTEVQILQGAQEFGKDIVFRSQGPLDEIVYCACVVKNTRLTGKVGTTGSVRAVYDQIEQALDTPFVDGSGESQRVHRVYVMSPEEIGASALNSIVGKLAARSGQVVFKCGLALFEMFLRHWPDYVADEGPLLATYAARLEEAGRSAKALNVLALEHSLGSVPDAGRQIYVEPSFQRELFQYDLTWSDSWIFDVRDLNSEWSRSRIVRVRKSLDQSIDLLQHCSLWPFPDLEFLNNISEIRDLASKYVGALQDALLNAMRAKSGNQRTTYTKIHDTTRLTLLLSEIRALSEIVKQLGDALSPHRLFMELAIQTYNRQVSSTQPHFGLLEDPIFKNLCAIDDCLRAYSGPLLKPIGRELFNLGKGIHRRYRGALIIEGGPGSGKTSFCRWNALVDASKLVDSSETVVPIYVPLHELGATSTGTFEELFLSRLGRSILLPKRALTRSSLPTRLYLDGLDEVTEEQNRQRLMSVAREGAKSLESCQIVVTVRDYVREPSLKWAPRIALSGLDEDELRKLATMWLDGDEAAAHLFMREVMSLPALSAVARTPLLATVMILVFKRTGRVPDNRARLYSVFVNLLCGGWDLAKGIVRTSKYGVSYKLRVLNSIGIQLHHARKKEFDINWFINAACRVIQRQREENITALLGELLADGILTRSSDICEFSHLSFQEFFAARALLGEPGGGGRNTVLQKFFNGDLWWREVLIFYIALSENPESVFKWISIGGERHEAGNEGLRVLLTALQTEFPDFDPETAFTRRR